MTGSTTRGPFAHLLLAGAISCMAVVHPAAAQSGAGDIASPQEQNQTGTDERTYPREEFLSVLSQLDSDDYATREGASQLLATISIDQSFVVGLLKDGGLSAEQRLRLLTWLRGSFESTPRGAVGVAFGNPLPGLGIQIASVVDGMPAVKADLVRAGDVLAEVNGVSLAAVPEEALLQLAGVSRLSAVPLPYSQVMRHAAMTQIVSHDPGEKLPVRLLRPSPDLVGPPATLARVTQDAMGEAGLTGWMPDGLLEVRCEIPLGSFRDLNQMLPASPEVLDGAWRARIERLGLKPRMLASTIEPQGWSRYDPSDPALFAQWANSARTEALSDVVGAAGGGLTPAASVVPASLDSARFAGLNAEERQMLADAIARNQRNLANAQRRLNQQPGGLNARVRAIEPGAARAGAQAGGGRAGGGADMVGARVVRRDSAQRLTDEIAEVRRMLDSYTRRAADQDLTPSQRRVVEARIKQSEDRLQSLEERLRRAAAREAGVVNVPPAGGAIETPRF